TRIRSPGSPAFQEKESIQSLNRLNVAIIRRDRVRNEHPSPVSARRFWRGRRRALRRRANTDPVCRTTEDPIPKSPDGVIDLPPISRQRDRPGPQPLVSVTNKDLAFWVRSVGPAVDEHAFLQIERGDVCQ